MAPDEGDAVPIIRNDDGTLVVPVQPDRHRDSDDAGDVAGGRQVEGGAAGADGAAGAATDAVPETRILHPGEGGYDEALAAWDAEQNPDREPPVSTATGREQAMVLVNEVATSPDHEVAEAVAALDDPDASADALRHVLVGGVHAVEDFAAEVAAAEGGEPLPPHEATKIIGEVLAELE